jgi:hypothetical protein
MNPPAGESLFDPRRPSLYVLAVLIEVIVVSLLWLFGRYFGS